MQTRTLVSRSQGRSEHAKISCAIVGTYGILVGTPPMEDLVVAFLCVAVFWLVLRQLRRKNLDRLVFMQGKFQMRMPGQVEWKSYLEWRGPKRT